MSSTVDRGAAVLLALALVVAGVPVAAAAPAPAPSIADGGATVGVGDDAPDGASGGDANATTAVVDADPADRGGDDESDAGDREPRTLTYRGVEFTVEKSDEVAATGVEGSPFGDPVDGDRYLVHVVLVADDPAHEATLESLGAEVHLRVGRDVEVLANETTIERLRASPVVAAVRPPQYLHHPDPAPRVDRDGDGRDADLRAASAVRAAAGPVVSEGVARIGADRVHARGITGAGVTVGVVDAGFDPENPEYADNLVAARSLTADGQFDGDGADSVHGTGVTELVVDVAPDARVYYAEVNTGVQFAAALQWLAAEDVDVVSTSYGYFDHPGDPDGSGNVADRAVGEAVDAGILTVAHAGNYADRYWTGPPSDTDGDGVYEFDAAGTELTLLNDGWGVDEGSRFLFFMYWEAEPEPATEYVVTVWEQTSPTTLAPRVWWDTRSFAIDRSFFAWWEVPATSANPHYLSVERVAGPDPERIHLYTPRTTIDVATPARSVISPSTAPDALTVGAYDQRSGRLTSYSSHGPTRDGRLGVDVLGPSHVTSTAYEGYTDDPWGFSGTSAAQPHVAGVAALLLQADPSLTPAEVEAILTETAIDAGEPGPDTKTGYGYVDAVAAASVALNETPAADRVPPSTRPPTGEWTLLFTDDDEPDLPVDLAAVYAQHDADTLYLRYEFHGDYAPDSGESDVWAQVLVDADDDAETGRPYAPGGLGVEHLVSVSPWQFESLDLSTGEFVSTGTAAVHFAPDFDGDAHVVGISREALGDPASVRLAARGQYGPVNDGWLYDFVPDADSVVYAFENASEGPIFDSPIPGTGGGTPTDPDGDGMYEDVDGDGRATFDDAIALAFADASRLTTAQIAALDFDGDGAVGFGDAIELAFLV